jgi:hypothetical protein
MTPLEQRLRAAIRETADEIPADPPPLRLNRPGRQGMSPGGRTARHRGRAWRAWGTPLAAAAVVFAVIAASLALTGGPAVTGPGPAGPQTGPASVPPYYVALVTGHGAPSAPGTLGVAAEVRATLTGAVLARIVPPKPYVTFTGVTAAADDRTFVLAAQATQWPNGIRPGQPVPASLQNYVPPARFYLLHIDPASPNRGGRASLRALPASFIPADTGEYDMALSPDGTRLAANIGNLQVRPGAPLYVFNLATGTKRVWSYRACASCASAGGGSYGLVNIDPVSWVADNRHLAFVGPTQTVPEVGTVRLLDTNAPGGNLLADSTLLAGRPIANISPGDGTSWYGALITPDGQTVVAVLEIASMSNVPPPRQRLVKISAATGKVTATLNSPRIGNYYEQLLYTNTTGNVLVVSYARPGNSAGILRDGTYTPIPWNTQTIVAAW